MTAEAPFLSRDQPPIVARGLSTLLLVAFAVCVVVSVTVSIPETVSAPFVLVPARGTDPVRAPRSGVIGRALASLGGPVVKGDPLFEIRSPEFSDRFSERQTLDTTALGAGRSLANARERRRSEARVAEEEARGLNERLASIDRSLALKTEQLRLLGEQVDRFARLSEQGLTSAHERTDAEIRRSQAVLERESLRAERTAALSSLQKLRDGETVKRAAFREEERVSLEKAEQARIRSSALTGETTDAKTANLTVVAPCDGMVTLVKVKSAATVVIEGDALAEIACAGETQQAQVEIPQSGVARIRVGQTVRLLFDSFPYQRFGAQPGKVRWISPTGAAGSAFPVLVDLDIQSIEIDEGRAAFVTGMRGTARIVVGRRTLIDFALQPLRGARETLR